MHFQPSKVMNLLTFFSGTNFTLTRGMFPTGLFFAETDCDFAPITLQFYRKFQWIKDSKKFELVTLIEVEGGNFFCQTDLFASWQFLTQPKMTRCLSKDWLNFKSVGGKNILTYFFSYFSKLHRKILSICSFETNQKLSLDLTLKFKICHMSNWFWFEAYW